MKITSDNKLKKLIVVGDRVLLKPTKQTEKTASGLYLPPGVQEKEKIQSGYVIKVGPGYPLPLPADEDDMWKGKEDQVKYLPLQAQEGDLAIFLQKGEAKGAAVQNGYDMLVGQAEASWRIWNEVA